MILVTGATGQLGRKTIDFLLEKTSPQNMGALVRDTAKGAEIAAKGVELRQGDYNDYPSLVNAFRGVDKLYFVSGNDIPNRGQQHQNVVNAAKEAGVGHVFYTSFQRKNESLSSPIAMVAKSHIDTENLLKASGLNYTILKHGLYMEMLPAFMGDKVLETGVIFLPSGEGKAAYTAREDMAEAAATLLTTDGHENKAYEISANGSWSWHDIAATLNALSGKAISYVSPTPEVYKAELSKAGVPDMYVGIFASFGEAIRQGEFDITDPTLENLLGRKTTSPRDFLKAVYGL
ncbi:MAG: SDR family oxidoreductase [Bacteroidia bacterium]|nr:SDR family oxidoreductase [Bacteroidia bacterium]